VNERTKGSTEILGEARVGINRRGHEQKISGAVPLLNHSTHSKGTKNK
jgi:hypothetical protein